MTKPADIDALQLAGDLIRCPSVTPEDAGALDVLDQALSALGFKVTRVTFEDEGTPPVANLYARFGTEAPNLIFAGHTDVVPVGDGDAWSFDPFSGEVDQGWLLGRGACDMKAAIAAFAEAASRAIKDGAVKGSVSFLITGDEEGPAINGTVKLLQYMMDQGESFDHCIVGEPTCPERLGDIIKIGRRGSINTVLTVLGAQGHVAYPHLADNPVPRLVKTLDQLTSHVLDEGTDHFPASNLEVTSVDVGNPATNVIPASATARFNIRFNDQHDLDSLESWITAVCDAHAGTYEISFSRTGNAFLTRPGDWTSLAAEAVADVTGETPDLSTTGGTSDARFIKDYCPVLEFGMVGQTMHKVDEKVRADDVTRLTDIYEKIIRGYFEKGIT